MLHLQESQLKQILNKSGYRVSSSLSLCKNIKSISQPKAQTACKSISSNKKKNFKIATDVNRHGLALSKLKLKPELETGVDLAGTKVSRANFEHWHQVRLFDYIYREHHEFYLDFAAVPNGGLRTNKGASELLDEGVRNGFPDIIGDLSRSVYIGLRIELKHGNNKPSVEQVEQLNRKRGRGYFCALCYSFEEARQVVDEYLGLQEDQRMRWCQNENLWVR
ncbi:hypothetical protein GCM10011607_12340 [Shewanella inventionis]|uniref:VRR-NUC domain-containing protein n=1 Tax=Shewanella inventionis TaxID=1738770 RepID=A0ABQ1IV95_9GAMM|nr:VRR-NUC domain-containing protein [Shewanella inventionis]GGB53321.1 hypothetical protein GCM10011607_12340 [Shewanella inventionis]